jgi:hypothetical protein
MRTIDAYSHALPRRLRMPYLREGALDVVPTARAQRSDPAKLLRGAYRRDHRGDRANPADLATRPGCLAICIRFAATPGVGSVDDSARSLHQIPARDWPLKPRQPEKAARTPYSTSGRPASARARQSRFSTVTLANVPDSFGSLEYSIRTD